jgi:hypothetical protein
MARFSIGDRVVTNEKVDRLPGMKSGLARPGLSGEVLDIEYENKRKNKQWVLVALRRESGHTYARQRYPSNWLDIEEQ